MLAGEAAVAAAFVPASAREVFGSAWRVLALSQPVNAVSFVTDGIHWGTRDYRYLRNAMLTASSGGVAALALLPAGAAGLTAVWLVTSAWIAVRAGFGLLRVWPGIGRAPLARA
jgi:MATE family multidrug resistance protein